MDARERRGALLMLLCSLMWSTGGMFIRLLPWNPLVIAGARSLIAAGVLGIYMLKTKQRILLDKHSIRLMLVLALCMIAFVMANKLSSAANAVVLQYTAPIYVLLYGWLFKKRKVRAIDCMAVVCVSGGVALLFADGLGGGSLLGNGLGLVSGMAFGMIHASSNAAPRQSRMSGLLLGHLLAAAIGMPFMAVYETPLAAQYIGTVFLLGVVQVGLPYVLFGWATEYCSALTSVLMGALEPLLSPVWVFMVSGDLPSSWAIAGCAVIILAVTSWCAWNAKHPAPSQSDRQ